PEPGSSAVRPCDSNDREHRHRNLETPGASVASDKRPAPQCPLVRNTGSLRRLRRRGLKMLLTRRYRFVASHRLNAPSLSEEENRRLYGKCNNPHGHGHDYVLDITIEGRPDDSGQLVQREFFDRMIQEQVLTKLDHQNLNDIIPEVATTENLAKL